MPVLTTVMRANMKALSPFLKSASMESARAMQRVMGELMSGINIKDTDKSEHIDIGGFHVCWAEPLHTPRHGVCIYFHGGGYVAGDLDYATIFGRILAAETHRRVLCVDYRLAPEHPFPAALDDAVHAYEYLLSQGYDGCEIVIIGESAGGGLAFALALRLEQLSLPRPAGIVALSPWVDLTLSGESYQTNFDVELCLSQPMIDFYAESYAGGDRLNPLVSPLFGDLRNLPPCLIYAGGDELLLSDSVNMAERLEEQGVWCRLHIEPKMWHGYVLYGVAESRRALDEIAEFVEDLIM